MLNLKNENEKLELQIIGGNKAIEIADKYKLDYFKIKEILLTGVSVEELEKYINISINFYNKINEAALILISKIKMIFNNIDHNKVYKFCKYKKRCKNREILYSKKKRLGRVK